MEVPFINILLAFIEGLGLILSPCILPILPLFLAGSLTGSKRRPMGIIVGFTFSFSVLVFFSHQLVGHLGINFNWIRQLGYIILILLGIIMISNYLTEQFGKITQGFTRISYFFQSTNHLEKGFGNGFLFGSIIAIIWTPCAGPILAAVLVQIALQKSTTASFLALLAFSWGAAIPMFIISLYGKKIIDTFNFFKTSSHLFRKLLGMLIIASVVYLAFFEEEVVSTKVNPQTGMKTSTSLINGLWLPYKAPPIQNSDEWINSSPLRITDLHGKVVLIDFWTYSCINCLRTLPYIKDWYQRYRDKGLVIIGVHTPEFEFEKNLDNVKAAIKRHGILYPVVLDNHNVTWTNYDNHFWPAHYLINQKGDIVYKQFGEGDYDITENNIRFLLGVNNLTNLNSKQNNSFNYLQTPETYLGYEKANSDYSPKLILNQITKYQFTPKLAEHSWSLNGLWQSKDEYIQAEEAHAAIKIHFNARKIFVVMGNYSSQPIKVKILLTDEQAKKLKESEVLVNQFSIYDIATMEHFGKGYLILITSAPGVKFYTFTFGS